MSYVIQMQHYATGTPFEDAGYFLRSFDFEADEGYGDGTFTADVREAKQFASKGEALGYWRTTSRTRPQRDDGQPNRPLTAWTVIICPVSDFTEEE